MYKVGERDNVMRVTQNDADTRRMDNIALGKYWLTDGKGVGDLCW